MLFDTHGKDSYLKQYDGTKIKDIQPLSEDEYDKIETGPMFRLLLENGVETDAFEDEIIAE